MRGLRDHVPFLALRTAVALLLAFGVSLVIYRQATIARGVEFGNLEEIANIGRDSPGYLTMRAGRQFASGNPADALAKSQRALLAMPANPAALRVLALASDSLGQRDMAGRAMSLAGLWGWRDPITQLWLMNEAGKRADLSNMLIHADALLRTEGPSNRIFALIAATIAVRGGVDLVSERLADQPNWRSGFFNYLGKAGLAESGSIVPLAARMRGPNSLTSAEVAPIVNALLAADRAPEAYAIWREAFAARGYARGNAIFDPGFEHHVVDTRGQVSRFDWTVLDRPGLDIGVRPAPSKGGKALFVRFTGEEGASLIRQDLMLPAGSHELRLSTLRDGSGAPVIWKMWCHDGGEIDLSGKPNARAGRWVEEAYALSVPLGCPRQTLELDGLSGDGGSDGTTWIDDVFMAS